MVIHIFLGSISNHIVGRYYFTSCGVIYFGKIKYVMWLSPYPLYVLVILYNHYLVQGYYHLLGFNLIYYRLVRSFSVCLSKSSIEDTFLVRYSNERFVEENVDHMFWNIKIASTRNC